MASMSRLLDDYQRTTAASERCRKCGRQRAPMAEGVKLHRRKDTGRSHFDGLYRCGSIWECPECGARIRAGRADELRQVVDWHADLHGRETVQLLTLTFRHYRRHKLRPLRCGLTASWKRVQQQRAFKDWSVRLGFKGKWVRAIEPTHGANGFHPHLHLLLFMNATPPAEFTDWLRDAWRAAVVAQLGAEHRPDDVHGVDLRACNKADYLAKLGLELTAPTPKLGRGDGSRSMLQILADFTAAGDLADLALYAEYADGMKGCRMLEYARGLKKLAGVAGIEVRSDEQIIEGEEGPEEEIASFTPAEWTQIIRIRHGRARLIEASDRAGSAGVEDLLGRLLGRFGGHLRPPPPS